MKFDYEEFTSRNWLFIDEYLQCKIRNKIILFIGCGLSSYACELAVRLGFQNFIFIDGDKVDLSNLNRQTYSISDIDKFKVLSLRKRMRAINPKVTIDIVKNYIYDSSQLINIINKADYVINTVDMGSIYSSIIELAIKNNKVIFMPFNVGFGSLIIACNKFDHKVSDLISASHDSEDDLSFLFKLIDKYKSINIPNYIINNLSKIKLETNHKNFNSQNCIASFFSASLLMTMIINLIKDENIKYYPELNYIDLIKLISL